MVDQIPNVIPQWIRDAHRDVIESVGGDYARGSVYVGAAGLFNADGYAVHVDVGTMELDPYAYVPVVATGINLLGSGLLAEFLGTTFRGMCKTLEDMEPDEKLEEVRQATDEAIRVWISTELENAGRIIQDRARRGHLGEVDHVVMAGMSQIISAWIQVTRSAIQFKVPEMPE